MSCDTYWVIGMSKKITDNKKSQCFIFMKTIHETHDRVAIVPLSSPTRTERGTNSTFSEVDESTSSPSCQLTPFPWRSVLSDDVATATAASPLPPSLPLPRQLTRPPLGRKLQQA